VLVTIPIETKRRELVGKTWLAYHLLLRGHAVAIGPAYEIGANLPTRSVQIFRCCSRRSTSSIIQVMPTLEPYGSEMRRAR
jgi:hypothetical protein